MLGNLSCNVRLGYPTINVMSSTHWERFGSWLRQQRRLADLTQKNLADMAGIHEVQLARIEKGESGTKRDTVLALAKALNVDVDESLELAGFARSKTIYIETSGHYDTAVKVTRDEPRKPRNYVELLQALEAVGIEIEWATIGNLENKTEDDFQELFERIQMDTNFSIKRKNK